MKKTIVTGVFAVALSIVSHAYAAPVPVGFPPSGGVAFGSSGPGPGFGVGDIVTPGGSVGRTWTYSNFNPAAGGYSDIWWGPVPTLLGPLFSGPSGSGQPLTLSSFSGNQATFTAPSPWTISRVGASTIQVPIRLTVETFDLSGAPISLIAASSVPGLVGSAGVVLDVTPYTDPGEGFHAVFAVQALSGGSWIGVDQFYNSTPFTYPCGNCVVKSFGAAFWEEAAPTSVPEPVSSLLLCAGVLALAGGRAVGRKLNLGA